MERELKKTFKIKALLDRKFCDPEIYYTNFVDEVALKLDTKGYNIPMLYIAYRVFSLGPISYKWTELQLTYHDNTYTLIKRFLDASDIYIERHVRDTDYYSRVTCKGYSFEAFIFDIKTHLGYICYSSLSANTIVKDDEIEDDKALYDKEYGIF